MNEEDKNLLETIIFNHKLYDLLDKEFVKNLNSELFDLYEYENYKLMFDTLRKDLDNNRCIDYECYSFTYILKYSIAFFYHGLNKNIKENNITYWWKDEKLF